MRLRRGCSEELQNAPYYCSQPRTVGLMTCASSGRVWPVRRCSLKDRTCALALCKASLLIAGRNDVKLRPFVPPKGPSILHLCTAPHQEDLPRRLLSAFVA